MRGKTRRSRTWRCRLMPGQRRVPDFGQGGRETPRQDRSTGGGTGFFSHCLQSHPRERRQKAIKRDHPRLSLRRQCTLLSLTRSTLYYQPRGESAENLKFMELIDKQFPETPWYGSRQMARHLQRSGRKCGCYRVRRLMKLMRLVPICQEPRTRQKHPEHKIYPDGAGGPVSGRHHGLV